MFHVIRDYVRLIDADPHYLAVADRLEQAQAPLPIVFGHHDLLPGNFMDDGRRLWLIDWEYGGFGTAMFDLADLSSNGASIRPRMIALLDAYFAGKADDCAASFIRRHESGQRAARGAVGHGFRRPSADAWRRLQGARQGLSRAVREADAGLIAAAAARSA